MWFKQASIFVLGEPVDTEALSKQLEKRPFSEPTGLDWFSQGWVTPASHLENPVFTLQNAYALVCLRRDDKVLPAGVIREALNKKIDQIEADELRKVSRKEQLSLKEQVTDDLLPRAFTAASHTHAYLDQSRGFLLVDSASAQKAERLVSELREALPPFPCAIPRVKVAPHAVMTDWLAAGEAATGFELDSDATLKDANENGAKVTVRRADLTAEEIRQHIAAGKQVTELGLIYRERIRFVLTDQLQLKRLQFLDVLQEEASQAGDDMATLFEATFMLMAEELGELVTDLIAALGGLVEPESAKEAA